MTQEITMGSLFSGSGGFELAGSIFGIRPIWASEIEPFPILVTTKNFPEMKHLGDINKLNGADLEPVTIIAGGSPCQDMSIAGKREGLDGSRSNLFREQIRIIKEMPDSTPLVVALALIDSGNDADTVYDFCANNSEWALPSKGSSNPMLSHYKLSKVNKSDSKAYGMNLVLVDTGKYKDMIAGRMQKKNGSGSWMVYQGCDREYAEQVTAEHKVNVKMGNGKVKQEWQQKTSHADNHYLDCEVYATAAADILGVRTLHLNEIQENEQPKKQETTQYTPEEHWISQNEGSWV